MDSQHRDFRSVVNRWPSAEALAVDIGEAGGTVRQWRNRNSIPSAYWTAVVGAAAERGFEDVTLEILAALSASEAKSQRDQAAVQSEVDLPV